MGYRLARSVRSSGLARGGFLLLAALLLVLAVPGPSPAGPLPTTTGDHAPFPAPARRLTLGEFLDLVSAPEALDLNLVVRDSVPKGRPLGYSFAKMTCREALELVLSLEGLELIPFRPGIYVVQSAQDRRGVGTVERRVYRLTYTTAEKVLTALRANPGLLARIDLGGCTAGPDGKTLVLYDAPRGHEAMVEALGQFDRAAGTRTEVISLGYLSKEDLDAALRALGPEATGGVLPENLAHLKAAGSVAVNGPPEQIARLRSLVEKLSVAPEQVQIGVTSSSLSRDRSREMGLAIDNVSFAVLPGHPPTIGGRVVYGSSSHRSSGSGTLWITALSGYPARFSLGEVFMIPVTQVIVGPGGPVVAGTGANEVPVGLMLEVLPRVTGPLVSVDVSFVDESPTRVSDVGVDRSSRNLVTKAVLRRGQSIAIGGLNRALSETGGSGVANLLRRCSDRGESLSIILTVR
ncbi:MAG: hypothetical protein HY815_19230 [Candidatus Riflebacteria bacterium]|nr:hypothetical protein [Candidatus Riflebacteria bacterium]